MHDDVSETGLRRAAGVIRRVDNASAAGDLILKLTKRAAARSVRTDLPVVVSEHGHSRLTILVDPREAIAHHVDHGDIVVDLDGCGLREEDRRSKRA